MNLEKIGRYIADKRKALGLTQRQLAEKLGMSDKSVSKWERGVCLPDVSVYLELCAILGITINEFLAGEDIQPEQLVEKSEDNLMQVSTDSQHRQTRLKRIIAILIVLFLAASVALGGVFWYLNRPQNFIAPVDPESPEMKTAQLLSDMGGAQLFRYTVSEEFSSLSLVLSEYESGKLVNHSETANLGYNADFPSSDHGMVAIVPDFGNDKIKLVLADDSGRISTELPVPEELSQKMARITIGLEEELPVRYDEDLGLLVIFFDDDGMRSGSLTELAQGECPEENEYAYYFALRFNR